MAVDPQTVQELAQQKAAPMRMDESRPKRDVYGIQDPYQQVLQQEQKVLDDPRSAPGVAGFERELQTQSNQANEKLRGRIAGVSDPMAVGRELARMDQSTRNQLAVYLSQRQQDAQQAMRQAAAGSAQFQMNQFNAQENQDQFWGRLDEDKRQFWGAQDLREREFGEGQKQFWGNFGEQQRQYDTTLGENQKQFWGNFGEGQRQFDAGQSLREREFQENARRFGIQYAMKQQEMAETRRQYDNEAAQAAYQFEQNKNVAQQTATTAQRQQGRSNMLGWAGALASPIATVVGSFLKSGSNDGWEVW